MALNEAQAQTPNNQIFAQTYSVFKKYIYKMVFFRPEKISTLNFSPECKSHITSLVGGGVVGEVIGEVVGEVRAWLLTN